MTAHYVELARALSPEASLVLGALLLVGTDAALGKRWPAKVRLDVATGIAAAAIVIAGVFSWRVGAVGRAFGGVFNLDTLAVAGRLGVFGLALLVLGVTAGARPLRNAVDYVAIVLFAVCGFSLMTAANHLLLAFLALELASLSLYILVGFDKNRPESAEAALKYFLYGGMAAAFLLFGFSLLYGLTGSLELSRVSAALVFMGLNPLLGVALAMILVAFGFKTAAAPFHLWAPDAYQGAPLPAAALVASASKLAGLILFTRLFWSGLRFVAGNASIPDVVPGWISIVAALSFASLLIGNLAALAQTDVRRLLAYSAVAHAGGLLLGVITAGQAGGGPVFYYAVTYGIATAGAFGVLGLVDVGGGGLRIVDLAGLNRRSPLLAGCLGVFVLSLAGIPPLAGFFGKFAVYAAALSFQGVVSVTGGLAFLAIGFSAVALYYYLVVLKQVFVTSPAEGSGRIRVPVIAGLTLSVAAGLLLVLGILPSLVLRWLE